MSNNVSSITSSTSASSAATTDSVANPSQVLNQHDFLQLLVAQMQYQDPLNPQSDTEMASQMAQFTSLQQSSQMSSSLSMMQANSLVGSSVTVQLANSQNTTSGVVQGVVMSNGAPEIMVNGATYQLGQITAVNPTVAAQTTSSSASPSSN